MDTRSTDTGVWTRVSEDGKHAAAGMSLGSGNGSGNGSGGGMKIGAGRKPQPFMANGQYGETGGGSSTGPEYRGTVRLPHEVRGEVTPPAQTATVALPAPLNKSGRVRVSTTNDNSAKPDPNPAALNAETREHVQAALDKSPSVHDVNMNSGYRSGDPTAHGEGQAVDRINGQKVSDAVDPNVPEAQREAMRQRLREIRAAAEADPEVEAYIDPLGGFFRLKDRNSKEDGREANAKEIYEHRHHGHITIRKALQTRQ